MRRGLAVRGIFAAEPARVVRLEGSCGHACVSWVNLDREEGI